MSPILAGLVAGFPLAAILVILVIRRRYVLVHFFREGDENIAKLPENTFFYILLGCFTAAAFLFGALSGVVYGRLGLPGFRYLAFGAAVALSFLAVINKTGLKLDKILWNIAVGGVLGLLVPILAG